MRRLFSSFSSRRISYLSVACGSLVLYKGICARQRNKEYEKTLSASSHAASAAALSLPLTTFETNGKVVDNFANLAAAVDATCCSAQYNTAAPHPGSSVAGCIHHTYHNKSFLNIPRNMWREIIGSAKAAANAAGVSKRDLDPRQFAAAIAAAQVLSKTQSHLSVSPALDHTPSSRFLPALQMFISSSYFPRLVRPLLNANAPTADAHPEKGTSWPDLDTSAVTDNTTSSDVLGSAPNFLHDVPQQRLCVGRIAAVQVENRRPRIVWPRNQASKISDKETLREPMPKRPYVQKPGRFLRVTYQYFVVSPDKTHESSTVQTQTCHTGYHGQHSQKTPSANIENLADHTASPCSCDAPLLPHIEKQESAEREGEGMILQSTQAREQQQYLRWWEKFWPRSLRNTFDALTHMLSSSQPGTADKGAGSPADALDYVWMPPLSICEKTVEVRLPQERHREARRKKEKAPSIVDNHSRCHSNESFRGEPPVQVTPPDARGKAAVNIFQADKKFLQFCGVAVPETQAITATSAASAAVAGGDRVSDESTFFLRMSGDKYTNTADCRGGSRPSRSPDKDVEHEDMSLAALRPLKCLTQAWQDIKPQQLVVVSYDAAEPHRSTPLVVLTVPVKLGVAEVCKALRKEAVAKSSAYEGFARLGTEGKEEERKEAGGRANTEILSETLTMSAAPYTKSDACGEKSRVSPYLGEIIELAGYPFPREEEKMLFAGGGFLLGLGMLKLCMRKLYVRKFHF